MAAMDARSTPLALVRVVSNNLNFGCLQGVVEGTDIPVWMMLFENTKPRMRLLGEWPKKGDLLACEHVRHSVYNPRVYLDDENLHAQLLMSQRLPMALTAHYFGQRRPLVRVEA